METQNSFKTILENESVTVSALLCAETLKIKVKVTDSANEHFGQTFVTEVTEQQRNENQNKFFVNLQEIFIYMQKEKLIKVDLQERKITLFKITEPKKQILLLTNKLTKQQKENKEGSQNSYNLSCLSEIFNHCLGKSQINNDQIKKYFEIIVNQLITLKKEKENKHEQNETKIEVLDQEEQLLNIQQQNNQIQNEVQKQNKESQEKLAEFVDKICELQKQISVQNEKIERLQIKINEKNEKITENAEKIQKLSLLENDLSSKTVNVEQRLINLETKMKYLNNIIEIQKQKQMNLMQKCKNQINQKDYNFDGKTLTKKNENLNIFTFFEQIVFDVQFTFNVKIIQKNYKISIGVIDYKGYAKNKMNEKNYVGYFSDGLKFPKLIKQGNGFKVNDFVTVIVNRNTKTIKYYVNNKLQATENAQFLGHRNRGLFPFVCLTEIEDQIELIY